MGFIDQLRWNADRTALEAVYVRQSVIEARVEFLDAVLRVAPEVFTDLREVSKDKSAGSQEWLAEWQQRWGLTAEWCKFAAFHTANAPELPPFFIYPELCASRPFRPLPVPELPAFDPTRETWACYERRCRMLIAEYRRRSYTAAKLQKFESVQDRRSLRRHLSWLAAYQCLCAPFSVIAEAADLQRAAIDYGVKTAAKFIGLELRPAETTGAPKGVARRLLLERVSAGLRREAGGPQSE